jgi:hypothetical protein
MSFPWFLRGSLDSSGFWCRGHSSPQYQHGLRRIGHCNQPESLTPALPLLRQNKYPRTTLHALARVLAFLGFEAQITLIHQREGKSSSPPPLLCVCVWVCVAQRRQRRQIPRKKTAVMAEAVVDIDVGTQPFDLAFHPSSSLVAVSLITGRLHLWVSLSLATHERKGKCFAPNLDAAHNLSKPLSVCISSDRGIFTVVDGILLLQALQTVRKDIWFDWEEACVLMQLRIWRWTAAWKVSSVFLSSHMMVKKQLSELVFSLWHGYAKLGIVAGNGMWVYTVNPVVLCDLLVMADVRLSPSTIASS